LKFDEYIEEKQQRVSNTKQFTSPTSMAKVGVFAHNVSSEHMRPLIAMEVSPMIKSFTAFTSEIDNIEQAVAEITSQLGLEGNLLQNTVGILSCYSEFIDSGVVDALTRHLPFDILGATTIASAAAGEFSEFALVLMVLTSDDVSFTTGVTSPIVGEDEGPLKAVYDSAMAGKSKPPAMILSFAPLLLNGDFFVGAMNKISMGVPNFGMVSIDHTTNYNHMRVIYNGECHTDCYACILFHGEFSPTFYLATLPQEKVFSEKGVVTASRGHLLEAVNGMPAWNYLQSLGLKKNEEGIIGLNTFCFSMDYEDGTAPVLRAMLAFTPDDRYVVCAGEIPVGAGVSLVVVEEEKVLTSTAQLLEEIIAQVKPGSTALMFSCLGRYFALNFNSTDELKLLSEQMRGKDINYTITYSGGEFCPVSKESANLVNRSHNNTFVVCVF